MSNWLNNINRYFKIAAITAGGLFVGGESKANNVGIETSETPIVHTLDVPQDFIRYEYANQIQYYQVDTIYNSEIIDKVNKGTYAGNVAIYQFDENLTTKYYFAGAKKQPDSGTPESVEVHEGTHGRYSNLYGLPIGKISPAQAYALEIAIEFNAYLYQTMYEMNKSAEADSIVGLLHDANFDFGNQLQKGWLYKYTSSKQKDREKLLSLMVNNVFSHTYSMMTASDDYKKQLLSAAETMSDDTGIPAKIKEENFKKALVGAFTIQVCDSAGKVFDLNVYDYLTPENKALLTKIAPQHRKSINDITAQRRAEIIENTQERLADWKKVAIQIANGNEGMTEADVLKQLNEDFLKSAREFTFPGKVHGKQYSRKHRASEVMPMPRYDVYFHLAPDYYEYMESQNTAAANAQHLQRVKARQQDLSKAKGKSNKSAFKHVTAARMPRQGLMPMRTKEERR